jgi:hypothetical protein
MTKAPTIWSAPDGSSTQTSTAGGKLQLQSSTGFLLLESGGHLLLEDVEIIPKPFTDWSLPAAKAQTNWSTPDGATLLRQIVGLQRYEQDGVIIRTLQDGTPRVLESTFATNKPNTVWGDS